MADTLRRIEKSHAETLERMEKGHKEALDTAISANKLEVSQMKKDLENRISAVSKRAEEEKKRDYIPVIKGQVATAILQSIGIKVGLRARDCTSFEDILKHDRVSSDKDAVAYVETAEAKFKSALLKFSCDDSETADEVLSDWKRGRISSCHPACPHYTHAFSRDFEAYDCNYNPEDVVEAVYPQNSSRKKDRNTFQNVIRLLDEYNKTGSLLNPSQARPEYL